MLAQTHKMPSVTNMRETTLTEKIFVSHLKDTVLQHEKPLTLPNNPETFLSVIFHNEKIVPQDFLTAWSGPTPFSDSEIVDVNLIKCRKLTKNDPEVKKTFELTLEFRDKVLPFQPGDSFGFLCHNSSSEVETIMKCCKILELIDVPCEIRLNENLTQKKKKIPSHVPTFSNLRHIFTSCLDIRAVPKKVMLLSLSGYCDNQVEQKVLKFLCSREGSLHYSEFIVQHMMSIIDILQSFPSCHPPVECLIEHLPPLKPRFYSVASSPLESKQIFRIVFNVIKIKKSCQCCKKRKGVCSSWLERLSEKIMSESDGQGISKDTVDSIADDVSRLTLTAADKIAVPEIAVYKRKNSHFKLPLDKKSPVIMVGPGTGVAPFMGFLNHREQEKKDSEEKAQSGEMWLLYGCRYNEKDFLYREELDRMLQCHILSNLLTCFSRDKQSSTELSARYVQDLIRIHADGLWKVIENGAVIYVCGDAKTLVEAVRDSFKEIIRNINNLSDSDAENFMKSLEKDGRFLTDIWV